MLTDYFKENNRLYMMDNRKYYRNPQELVPEKIIGLKQERNQRLYLMKWRGISRAEYVNAEYIKRKYPYHVIEFYEACFNGTEQITLL